MSPILWRKGIPHSNSESRSVIDSTKLLGDLQRQAEYLHDAATVQTFADAMPDLLFVLNSKRQVVHANKAACRTAGCDNHDGLLGLSFGKALGCSRARKGSSDCETSEHCHT